MKSFIVFLVSLSAAGGNPQGEVKTLNDDPENSKQVLIGKQELLEFLETVFVFQVNNLYVYPLPFYHNFNSLNILKL